MHTKTIIRGKKITIVVFCIVSLCLIRVFFSCPFVLAMSLSDLEEKLNAAIRGSTTFSALELNAMDLNKDGKVDDEDLARYKWSLNNGYPVGLELYKWIVAASFTFDVSGDAKGKHTVPIGYTFGLMFDQGRATIVEISGFDPTKAILKQAVARPGEMPGSQRSLYLVSQVIPKDTKFNVSENGNIVTLTSDYVTIAKDDPKNPTGLEYKRKWTINIDWNLISHGKNLKHGTIVEHTEGFTPKPIESGTGTIYMAPFSPKDLEPIELP